MPTAHPPSDARPDLSVNPVFTRQPMHIPRYRLPDGELDADVAYQVVHDELMLDGNARLNLATFVTTWAEPQARQLMAESLDKNMIDKDEYPRTADLENRCVHMLADLWHAPDPEHTIGCSTTGSSEACMLGGLALKRRWQHARRAADKPVDRPNIVMGINVQICWDKFANYFDVEPRLVPMEGDRLHLGAAEAAAACDENTIGVVAVLGSTFDGSYEPVADICAALDDLQQRTGLDIPVHVDGASGRHDRALLRPGAGLGLPSPPGRVDQHVGPQVRPGQPGRRLGGVARPRGPARGPGLQRQLPGRRDADLRDQLLPPGGQVIAQYYNFLRLGRDGYRRVQYACRLVAKQLAAAIAELGPFRLLTDGTQLPVFAFVVGDGQPFSAFDVSAGLREQGWLVPAYTFPKNREDITALRIVVRNGFTHDLADLLLDDLRRVLDRLRQQTAPARGPESASFAHGTR